MREHARRTRALFRTHPFVPLPGHSTPGSSPHCFLFAGDAWRYGPPGLVSHGLRALKIGGFVGGATRTTQRQASERSYPIPVAPKGVSPEGSIATRGMDTPTIPTGEFGYSHTYKILLGEKGGSFWMALWAPLGWRFHPHVAEDQEENDV